MLYIYPDYYKEFSCTADACEDTCCAGWQICIDEKTLKKYRQVKGTYRKKMRHSINWKKGMFCQKEEKRCVFLREDNLCDMYAVLGAESLCRTCRLYPRHIEEFEGIREISLSASCPEVARILLTRNQPVKFHSIERPGEETYDDFDPFLYSVLADARETLFGILQEPETPVDTKILLMLGLAWDVQRRVDKSELFACEEVLKKYQDGKWNKAAERKKQQHEAQKEKHFRFMKKLFRNLHELELLKEDWLIFLRETEDCLYAGGSESYYEIQCEFNNWLKESSLNWEMIAQQLCVYYVYTYFCGSVYDGRIFAEAQMAAAYVYLIREMLTAKWLTNTKTLDIEDVIEIVYRFSRELEHSDRNLIVWENLLEGQKRLWLK